jgi:ADP-ribosylglycohydrolase
MSCQLIEQNMNVNRERIKNAWQGRISGCQLGKPVEVLSMQKGFQYLTEYLQSVDSYPLRDYINYDAREEVIFKASCKQHMVRSEPDDDINYSFLSLLMLEKHGAELETKDVARHWLKLLPAANTYTAERAAYKILMEKANEWFAEWEEPGFDLAECSDNPYNDWIGAQIRADVYGWTCPGNVELAAKLAAADAELSHRGDGVYGAVFVAALGAALAVEAPQQALQSAMKMIPEDSSAAEAIGLGLKLAGDAVGYQKIHSAYEGMSPVHTLNNLALVVWALYSNLDDYTKAICEVVAAGWDTDCNGATVGGLWAMQGEAIPDQWIEPWQGRVGLGLAGYDELSLDELVDRTVAVANTLGEEMPE